MTSVIERRTHARVDVALRFFGSAAAGSPLGRTLNLSRTGALLQWAPESGSARPPSAGLMIKFDIELPAGENCLRCRGRVVRIEVADERIPLVAVAISHMAFRKRAATAAAPADAVKPRVMTAGGSTG